MSTVKSMIGTRMGYCLGETRCKHVAHYGIRWTEMLNLGESVVGFREGDPLKSGKRCIPSKVSKGLERGEKKLGVLVSNS